MGKLNAISRALRIVDHYIRNVLSRLWIEPIILCALQCSNRSRDPGVLLNVLRRTIIDQKRLSIYSSGPKLRKLALQTSAHRVRWAILIKCPDFIEEIIS